MKDYDFVRAPWTSEQVDALNRWQRLGYVHEFTCNNDHPGDRTLFATLNGWVCAHCDYRQDWAHAAMLLPRPDRARPLPCDVMLPPDIIVPKGSDYETLFGMLTLRSAQPNDVNRFNEPRAPDEKTKKEDRPQPPEDWS